MNLIFKHFKGEATREIFADLAKVRIGVFRDFPYLYEGSLEYEMEYLEVYAQSEASLIFCVFDGAQLVGATTCLPLADENLYVQQPFLNAGLPEEEIFYFGESILFKEYRSLGLGHRFFEERENHALSFGRFRTLAFCAVDRDLNHPCKPDDYRSNDIFWEKRGFKKAPHLQSTFDWPEIGSEISTPKSMTYWLKQL